MLQGSVEASSVVASRSIANLDVKQHATASELSSQSDTDGPQSSLVTIVFTAGEESACGHA